MPKKAPVKAQIKAQKKTSKKPKKYENGRAIIKVVGIGGGGGNAISRMKENFVRGVEFIAINTDTQDLDFCNAHIKLAIGKSVTRGLGTGMDPELGRQAAEESRTEIVEALKGADLVFLTAGLGGGTGSGVLPLVAEVAKEIGALTIAVVTKPFSFEGGQRSRIAEEALIKIKERVDTYIVISNDKIFSIISKDTSINKAFEAIDNILRGAVQGISELIALPGIINVDFADVRAIMQGSGEALVGIGFAGGKERGVNAVKQVLSFPLLDVSIDGAKSILFGISGGKDLKMSEVNDIAKIITENSDTAAKIIFGAYHDRKVGKGRLKVTLIAAGFSSSGSGLTRSSQSSEPSEVKMSSLFQEPIGIKISKPIESQIIEKQIEKQEKVVDKPERVINNSKKSAEIWDIPAFLRRKKK